MDRQILIPLDGSPRAETILPRAAALARATARAVTLLLVEPAINPTLLPTLSRSMPTWSAAHGRWARPYLVAVAARLTAQGIAVRADVASGGDIGATIVERACAPEVDLIAMATHGRTGVERWILGSVAERVLRDTPKPLLLVRRQAELAAAESENDVAYRTVVVALDGSPFAAQALAAARGLAETTGATLLLLAVAPPVDDIALAEAGIAPLWMVAERADHQACLRRSLNRVAGRLRAGGLAVRTQVLAGEPVETMLQACTREAADVLVMATHGCRGLRRLLLGSVATGVLRHANVPVLLIRPRTAHLLEPTETGHARVAETVAAPGHGPGGCGAALSAPRP